MSTALTVAAVIVAGGSSQRFSNSGTNKLLALLAEDGPSVLQSSVQRIQQAYAFAQVVLVAPMQQLDAYKTHLLAIAPALTIVAGGETRQASVKNGLEALKALSPDLVAIHDAARPLVNPKRVEELITHVITQHSGGASLAIKVVDTLMQTHATSTEIIQNIDRETTWAITTPQVFWYQALSSAHQQLLPTCVVTDDLGVMQQAGYGPLTLLADSSENIKLTTPDQLPLLSYFYQRQANI